MKKINLLLLLLLFILNGFAQTPESFKYQAVVRNASGDIIVNQIVGVQIEILQGSNTGFVVYSETHSVMTNNFGLINFNIGEGSIQSGDFSLISWGTDNYFVKVSIDPSGGNNYIETGTSQLLSVPYALHAKTSDNSVDNLWNLNGNNIYYNNGNVGIGTGTPAGKFVIQANDNQGVDDALLEVLDKDGNPVFIVTSEGARLYVKEDSKGVSGGFAVGRFSSAKDFPDTSYFIVTPDSTRVYMRESDEKGVSGGFAVGRFSAAKTAADNIFYTDADSTRVYTDGNNTKGIAGGFAVGRFSSAKGSGDNYMYMIPDNYFIGHQAGEFLQNSSYTGKYNTFFGFQTGQHDTSGTNNVFIGHQTGLSNTSGSNNVFLGHVAGYSNTVGTSNTFVGDSCGYSNTVGNYNSFYGYLAGKSNISGDDNVFIGESAGYSNTSGHSNFIGGFKSGYENETGIRNVYIGNYAGYGNEDGSYNVQMGYFSGRLATNTNNNVTLGYYSGYNADTTSNCIMIGSYAGTFADHGENSVMIGSYSGYNNNGEHNIFIGTSSGRLNQSGFQNLFIGYEAGYSNVDGEGNVYLGHAAGYSNVSTDKNIAIGDSASFHQNGGYGNTVIGYRAGYDGTLYNNNTYIGAGAGKWNDDSNNTFIGEAAGGSGSSDGGHNILIGKYCGVYAEGDTNVVIGNYAGWNITGGRNVVLGFNAGRGNSSNKTASGNILIGYQAGYYNNTSNRLYIENSNSSSPLIYGEFDNDRIGINEGTPNAHLHVKQTIAGEEGIAIENNADGDDIWAFEIGTNDLNLSYNGINVGYWDEADGTYHDVSDMRLKKDISDYRKSVLSGVLKLKPVTYRLQHADENSKKTFGFLAQDVQEHFPELVYQSEEDWYSLHYSDFGILAVKAIQEQQSEIEKLKKENVVLYQKINKINDLEKQIQELKEIINSNQ